MASIKIDSVNKTYIKEDGTPLRVLADLTMNAEDGEFVSVLGPSGCGKSTTLDVIAGITERDSGHVSVGGSNDLGGISVGYVFQQPRLLNWRTVRENLEFALAARGFKRAQWDQRVPEALAVVGLSEFADEFPLRLSGGMQQRVALARALIVEPDVLLMDEPFGSLDEITARKMRIELLRLWEQTRKTILFVTHNALEAAYLSDRIYVTSQRPASIRAEIPVSVDRPRAPEDERFVSIQRQIIGELEECDPAHGQTAPV